MIVSFCDVQTVFQLRMVSKQHFDVANSVLRKRFNDLICPFVPQVDLFNDILLTHGAVISGSLALYFFVPCTRWYPSDMDVFVPHSQFAAFTHVLETNPALRLVPYTKPITDLWDLYVPWNPSDSLEIIDVRRYTTPTGRYIDAMQSRRDTPLSPLVECWTSLLTNFVSPNGCGSACPKPMFEGIGYSQDSLLTSRDRNYMLTYMTREFVKGQNFSFHPDDWGTWRDISYWKKREDYFCDSTGLVVDFSMRIDDQESSSLLPVEPLPDGWKLSIPFPTGACYT